VAAAVTAFAAVVVPPVQRYVTPAVEDEAVRLILVVVQVKVPVAGLTAGVAGAVIFCPITEDAVAVHPFVGLVIVTV
jgi:hypothetical protein